MALHAIKVEGANAFYQLEIRYMWQGFQMDVPSLSHWQGLINRDFHHVMLLPSYHNGRPVPSLSLARSGGSADARAVPTTHQLEVLEVTHRHGDGQRILPA